jgi:hypothetical protein
VLQRVLRGADRQNSRNDGVSPALRRSAIVSGAIHAAIILVLLIGIDAWRPGHRESDLGPCLLLV